MFIKTQFKGLKRLACYLGAHKYVRDPDRKAKSCEYCGKPLRDDLYSDYEITLSCGDKVTVKATDQVDARDAIIEKGSKAGLKSGITKDIESVELVGQSVHTIK